MKKKLNDQIEELPKQTEELQKQIGEWKEKYLRALADYQNLERRGREEKSEVRTFATEIMLTRLLPVLDTFQKAGDHLKDAGLDLAIKQLLAIFEEQAVERFEVLGKPFNPHEMECIEAVEGDEDKVVEEVLPGYKFCGKILRVAQVKVGKKINPTNEEK